MNKLQVQDQNNDVVQDDPTVDSIVTGAPSAAYNLNTGTPIRGPQDFLPFFAGQNLRRPGTVRLVQR